jgi:hypothetical protein
VNAKTLGEALAPPGPPPGGYLTEEQARLILTKMLRAIEAQIVAAQHLAAMATGRLQ